MKKLIATTLLTAATVATTWFSPAHAQMTMHFSAPFISNSGIVGVSEEEHFFTVAVTGFPLEALLISLPVQMQGELTSVKVTDNNDQEIGSNLTMSDGQVKVSFNTPVQPDTYVTVLLSGAVMDRAGGNALYRVTAIKQGLDEPFPIGSVMIRLSGVN